MEWLQHLVFFDGKFLGIEWHAWKVVGWVGNATFFSRFLVQWYATERHRKVVVPPSFWWLSLIGSGLLLSYALYRRDSVFIAAYIFTWIPYVRNLIIHHRHSRLEEPCLQCSKVVPAGANFCPHCGVKAPSTKTA